MLSRKRACLCVRPSHRDNRDPWLNAWTNWVQIWQYLLRTTATPPQRETPSSPEGELWGPTFWFLWEGIGQLWAIAIRFRTSIPLHKGNMPAKNQPIFKSKYESIKCAGYGHGIHKMPWRSKSLAFPNSPVADRKGIRAIKTPLQRKDSDVVCFVGIGASW